MNPLLKHGILFFSAVVFLAATVLVVPMPAEDDAALSNVRFGYPFPFITQDFSDYVLPSVTFSRYVDFDTGRPVSGFSFGAFLLSVMSVALLLEAVVIPLELLKDRFVVGKERVS